MGLVPHAIPCTRQHTAEHGVTCTQNFDEVLVPADHVSRSPNDTYYVDSETGVLALPAHPARTMASHCLLPCLFFAPSHHEMCSPGPVKASRGRGCEDVREAKG